MPSIQDLPFELVQKITNFLGPQDKLSCAILRKSLYQPSLESLYQHVTLFNLVQFRLFLRSITHHRHHPNLYVKRLDITIGNWLEEFGVEVLVMTRSMTFTEFELLARYCVNLQTLSFPYYVKEYWEFMRELDLQQLFWPRLNDIPATRDTESGVQVYHDMASRLVKLDFRGPFKKPINYKNLVPLMQNLEIVRIWDTEITLDTDMVHLINNSLPRLQQLDLRTKFTAADHATTLRSKRATTIKSLHCDIEHTNSDWFPIIKKLYKNINSLSMRFRGKSNGDVDHLFSMIPQVQDIIQSTNIQHIQGEYSHIRDMAEFTEDFILETVYGYDVIMMNHQSSSAIALVLDYDDGSDYSQYTNMLTSGFSKRSQQQQHEFLLKCNINEDYNYNTMDFLHRVMKPPISLQLTRLTLKRRVYLHADYHLNHDDAHDIYLDSILDYFTNLETLDIQFELTKVDPGMKRRRFLTPPPKDEHNFSKLTLSSHKAPQVKHRSPLHRLKIKSTAIHRSVYPYLFKKCPNLSSLYLQDCTLKDEETVLALEYLCLINNVELMRF